MILRIDIHTQEKDCWKWNVSATGGFSLKSAWEAIRHKGGSFEFQNLIWFPSHYPKMDACLLRAIQMKLPTKDKLHQWGILQNNTCVLCNLYPEAISRLFFDCRYTSYIWALCKLKLGLSQLISSLTTEAIMLNSVGI